MVVRITSFFVALTWYSGGVIAHAATFTGIGQLPNGEYTSTEALSGNGTVLVGDARLQDKSPTAQVWKTDGSVQDLGVLPQQYNSYARGVSFDGSVVVGYSSGISQRAFRWTKETGMVSLGIVTGATNSTGMATNRDGSVVVGNVFSESSGWRAIRWNSSGGMVTLGQLPSGGSSSSAWDVSDNGEVIVGWSSLSSWQDRAFRWQNDTGMVSIGVLKGGEGGSSVATAISGNATTIVGSSDSPVGRQPFRWTQEGGMLGLGLLPGTLSGSALRVSLDGSVIVGYCGQQAFIWRADLGMRDLKEFLITDIGLSIQLEDWELQKANGLSDDGMTISGFGMHNGLKEAWVATIPEPSVAGLTLPAVLLGFLSRRRRAF